MTTPTNIAWGGYKQYEGAFYRGTAPFYLPANPSEAYKRLAILTATEGGRYDAINGYDRCIISVGLIQWCEAKYFLTSKLLGAIATKDPALMGPLQPALEASGAAFKKTARGRWRFHFEDARGEVDAGTEQKQLFLLNSSGHRGSWDEASKAHTKTWAAGLANVLAQPAAKGVQAEYTANRLLGFVMNDSRKILFKEDLPNDGWVGALRASFLSFAGNLPAVANKHLKIAVQNAPGSKWSEDWCIHVLKELTFGPKIAIYPHRYKAIRPVVEKLYGVDLPDYANDLKKWQADLNAGFDSPAEEEPNFTDPADIQQFFIDMGYDLGPAGADGVMGRKSREAIRTFQGLNGLEPDGVVGPMTRAALLKAYRDQASLQLEG